MFYEIFIGIVSLIGLLMGAELIIHNARDIAHRLKISEFFIGLTIFSIGTSLPEIATHVIASLDILRGGDMVTLSGLAIGTNIGSNIIQITLITGIVAFFGTLRSNRKFLRVDYVVMLLSIILVFIFSLNGKISRLEGAFLFFAYMAYLYYLAKSENLTKKIIKGAVKHKDRLHIYTDVIMIIAGLSALLLSADRLTDLALLFSDNYAISGTLLGILILGVSTALPELTTSIFALRKKNSGMSLGTLVGSNITNPLMALGLGAMISGYLIETTTLIFDIPFWFFTSLVLLLAMWKHNTLTHKGGILLALSYVLFIAVRLLVF